MANHSSAGVRNEAPHVNQSRTNAIVNVLKQRAEAVLNDESLDAESRAILRYALETHDPWLARLVRRAESENVQTEESKKEKIEALAEIICSAGEDSAAALLVLMGAFQDSGDPRVIANTVKHFAFTRCGELNFCGMVDAQVEAFENQLLRRHSPGS